MPKAPKLKTSDNTLPSLLAFSRKIEPSDAIMTSGNQNDIDNAQSWDIIALHERKNRGTKSHFGVKDVEKIQSNPVFGDGASLPYNHDTLRVSFSLKFLGDVAKTTVCNSPQFSQRLQEVVKDYNERTGFKELALRYAYNIANARFLWRNRVGAKQLLVKVTNPDNPQQTFEFDAKQFNIGGFESDNADLHALADLIAQALSGDSYLLLNIEAFSTLGNGQRVFPSQEMTEKDKNHKSKFLFSIKTENGDCAAMHSEKLGNAIRTIDNWHDFVDVETQTIRTIAVEPYGAVPSNGEAYRINKNDLYTLLKSWVKDNEVIADHDKHFVVANLIRGGIFGFGGKDDKQE